MSMKQKEESEDKVFVVDELQQSVVQTSMGWMIFGVGETKRVESDHYGVELLSLGF